MTKVFVYGTLRNREENHYLLKNAKYVGTTKTPEGLFALYDLGPFPTAVPVVDVVWSPSIVGEVYEVDDETLKQLDTLGPYRRIRVGTPLGECWIYVMDEVDITEYPIISNGDWVNCI